MTGNVRHIGHRGDNENMTDSGLPRIHVISDEDRRRFNIGLCDREIVAPSDTFDG